MVKQKGEYRRVVTQQLQAAFGADRFVRAACGSEVECGARAIPNRVALVGPTEALPDQDLPPLCSEGERASQSCAVLGGRLSHAAELVSLSHGLVLRWSFFLLVRWRPPLRRGSNSAA